MSLLEISFLGNKVTVFQDKLSFRKFFGLQGTAEIPLNQIASIDVSLIGIITIETTGGKKFAIPFIGRKKSERLKEVIFKAKTPS